MDIDPSSSVVEDAEMELDQPPAISTDMDFEVTNVVVGDVSMQQDVQDFTSTFSIASSAPPTLAISTFSSNSFSASSEPILDVPDELEMTPVEKEEPLLVTSQPLEVVQPQLDLTSPVELETAQSTPAEESFAVSAAVAPTVEEAKADSAPAEQVDIPLPAPSQGDDPPPETPYETEDNEEVLEEEPQQPAVNHNDEPDELEPTREGTPILDDLDGHDGSFSRPPPQLEYLSNVTMPAIPDAASDTSSETAIRAPPIKLSYLNETFWLFAEDPEEHVTPIASTSASAHHETGVLSVLLKDSDDHKLYYTSLESVFARLHEHFPSFAEDEMEMVLCMSPDYGVEISEDNTYAREISLYDLDRIHVGCNRDGRLHLTLDARMRAIYRFNTLAAHVASYTGLLPMNDSDPAVEEDGSVSDNDELDDLRDENSLGDDETEATAVDDALPDQEDKEAAAAGEADELDEPEGAAPGQYEDPVDESGGLEEALQDESAPEIEPEQNAATNGDHEADNVDELNQEDESTVVQLTNGDSEATKDVAAPVVVQEDEVAEAAVAKTQALSKSPKRSREDDAFTDLVNAPDAESIPESKRVRAS